MFDKGNNTEVIQKKLWLEAVRIIALFFVMYNHSSAYMFFADKNGIGYGISFFLSMICKSAVPLFFMISGVLLLGKNESFSDIFRKRVFRYIVLIILFSFLCYIKTVIRDKAPFPLVCFWVNIVREPIYLPYWFLYSYLAFLMMLPILRPLAQNISEKSVFYLILLQICFGSLKTVISYFTGISISNYFEFSGMFQNNIFYPLVGYGLVRYIKEEKSFWSRNNILRNIAVIPMAIITERIMRVEYQEAYLTIWIPVVSIILFMDIRIIFRQENLSEKWKRVLVEVGSCVFGCYLLGGLVGTGGKLGFFYQMAASVMGEVPVCILRIMCDFLVQMSIVMVLKRVPGMRRLL